MTLEEKAINLLKKINKDIDDNADLDKFCIVNSMTAMELDYFLDHLPSKYSTNHKMKG